MSDWLINALLGLIEGLTEFLPISSTGHLLLTEQLLGVERSELFNVVIQTGAVLAVLAVFTGRVRELLVHSRDQANQDYLFKLTAAFVLTAIGGLVMKKLGLSLPKTTAPIAYATLIGGVLFVAIEFWLRGRPTLASITWPIAVAVGVAQLVAVAFPGASRSGTTILIALAMGLNRSAATEFSFLLGIPTLLAAGAKELLDSLKHASEHEPWGQVILATAVAAVTAFLVVKWLLGYIRTHTFVPFGWYRIALGIAVLIWMR